MRRNFLRGFLIVLIPALLSAGIVGYAIYQDSNGQVGFRRGIDLAGGTILVYEVDKERTESKLDDDGEKKRQPITSEDIRQLAERLKRRIDPTDIYNVVVRPIGDSRVEIILPFTGASGGSKVAANAEFVEEVRKLVKQAGVLEFRILANMTDDKEGWDEAQRIISDPANKARLKELAEQGKPPMAPDRTFPVKAQGLEEIDVRYEWVELAAEERAALELSNEFSNKPSGRWADLAKVRGSTFPFVSRSRPPKEQSYSFLLYSRDLIKTALTDDEKPNADNPKGKQVEYYALTRISPKDRMRVTGDVRLASVQSSVDGRDQKPAVAFEFNPTGASKLGTMTERNKPTDAMLRSLAIVMDDKIVSAPTLNAVLRDRGQISGDSFKQDAVNRLVNILRSGNLNADLKPDPVSENTVGATLGESTIRKGLISVLVAFGAVLVFMVIYYKFAGFVACAALFVNLLLTVGFMVAFSAAFTLPGLAGLVLMLGMAVDANVLIYERIREERERGATLVQAIRLGYDRAFATIIDTHLTSIFTCIVLYMFGNDNLKGFSVSLTVGLIISLFTSLYMTRLMFDFWLHKKWMTDYRPLKLFSRPNLNFMKIRNAMFILTGTLTVGGLGLFLSRGERVLNVDFTKGTVYGGRLREGEERNLSTRDGKPGLLELLGEDRQKQRLRVKEVIPRFKSRQEGETASERTTSENIFEVYYENDPPGANGQPTPTFVSLANMPDGPTLEAQLADLKSRLSRLPDVSVEQVFLSSDNFSGGKSRSFTIRTTEREAEIVQINLDRLLRGDNNEPLLPRANVKNADKITNGLITLELDIEASPGYLKRFIERQLRLALEDRSQDFRTEELVVEGVKADNQVQRDYEERIQRYRTIRVDYKNIRVLRALTEPTAAAKDRDEATDLVQKALARALDTFTTRPLPERLETFDPALASDTRNKALFAIIASWIAILAFLWFRFGSWTFGLAAVVCLIHDLCFTLGCIAVCHFLHDTMIGHLLALQDFKIDLATVAALLTLVGYSVNDTIVVFDRIREVRGKNPLLTEQMLNDSVNQTLSRTILAAATVFLVVAVLYFFGGEGVHLFSFVMVMGVLVGTYSSIYIAAPLLLIFGEGHVTSSAQSAPVAVETAPSAITS